MPFENSRWIGMPSEHRGSAAVMFRLEFSVDSTVKNAKLHICGLGYYEGWINGNRVGDNLLDPGQSDYEKRCFYVTHDVKDLLKQGKNAIGAIIGDGWYNQDKVWKGGLSYGQPRLILQLEITFVDGPTIVLPTGTDWKCSTGAIVSSNIYAGEKYDARLEQPGWDYAGFDDSQWQNAVIVAPPGGKLVPQNFPPVKEIETIMPVNITKQPDGAYIVDMGQNFSGWVRINAQMPRGTEVKMTFAEAVDGHGSLDTSSTGVFATHVEQVDTYIFKGNGPETWQPRFTYHGFRYVKVQGWAGEFTSKNIVGVVVHTALKPVGKFECSDARLNLLHGMVMWTHRSNLHSIPEDCPARERCGWLGDAHLVCEYSMYNFDGLAFWEKYLDDIETTRELNGGLPCSVSPGKRTIETARPDWMAAMILIPWKLYVFTGKYDLLKKHFDGMKCVMDYFVAKSKDGILCDGYGDWCDPCIRCKPTYTPEALTTTAWFHETSRIMGNVSSLLGYQKLADDYRHIATDIRKAFIANFFDISAGSYGSQTANVIALKFGLVEDGQVPRIIESLLHDIRQIHNMHHTVGIMGMRYLFEVLSQFGYGDIGVMLMHQDTYPSFGNLINRGATTLWEYWGEKEIDETDGPRSLNHPMMGGFDNWFYNTLGGINPDPDKPGFRHMLLRPIPPAGMEWANVLYNSPAGNIVSQWKIPDGKFEWNISIPQGTTASAILPDSSKVYELSAGEYCFTCDLCRF